MVAVVRAVVEVVVGLQDGGAGRGGEGPGEVVQPSLVERLHLGEDLVADAVGLDEAEGDKVPERGALGGAGGGAARAGQVLLLAAAAAFAFGAGEDCQGKEKGSQCIEWVYEFSP